MMMNLSDLRTVRSCVELVVSLIVSVDGKLILKLQIGEFPPPEGPDRTRVDLSLKPLDVIMFNSQTITVFYCLHCVRSQVAFSSCRSQETMNPSPTWSHAVGRQQAPTVNNRFTLPERLWKFDCCQFPSLELRRNKMLVC